MLQILFYTFPGSDLTLVHYFNVFTTDMHWLLKRDYNHMISISHLVLFTPRRNLTSFSSSSPLYRVAIVLSNPAVLVPIICHVVPKHTDRPSPCFLSQSFPVTEGSVSLNLPVTDFSQSTSWIKRIWESFWQFFSLSEALRQPIALAQ